LTRKDGATLTDIGKAGFQISRNPSSADRRATWNENQRRKKEGELKKYIAKRA
jgi:hypothetical protein